MRYMLVVGRDVLPASEFVARLQARCSAVEEEHMRHFCPQGSLPRESTSPYRMIGSRREYRRQESHHTDGGNPRRGYMPPNHFQPS